MKPRLHRPHVSLQAYNDALRHGSPAQMFAVVAGVVLSVLGVAALIVNADFSTGSLLAPHSMLWFDVNGWSGVLYLVSGLATLFAAADAVRARSAAMFAGGLYLVLTVWSLIDSSILGLLPVNDPTAVLYAAIGVIGVTAALQPGESERDA
jgi:Domain of unknown function (DUF4383)